MPARWAAALAAFLTAGNGLFMLLDGPLWYARVPGAAETGPFNAHFVADIAIAFLAAGLGLGLRAWRPEYWPAALTGAVFLAGHALLHLLEMANGHHAGAAMALPAILLPAALALWAGLPTNETERRSHA